MMRSFVLFTLSLGVHGTSDADAVHYLHRLNGSRVDDAAFARAFAYFNSTFDHKLYAQFSRDLKEGAAKYRVRSVHQFFGPSSAGSHCDKGVGVVELAGKSIASAPGGITKRIPPDFSALLMKISAAGPPGASSPAMPLALGSMALQMGMGLVQTVASAIVQIVPPLIPPPVWINQPLPCAPMLTGHNCFGAVLYPITMADFIVADMSDKAMDGYLASFPTTYAGKVGKTSDTLYRACGMSYFSMHCSAIFPRCTMPMSRDEAIPVGGRVPLCLHLCIMPLVMCPGFWLGDVIGSCTMASIPPMCTQAFFWNHWRLPPQYTSFEESEPFPQECPDEDASASADDDIGLYEPAVEAVSPIEAALPAEPRMVVRSPE